VNPEPSEARSDTSANCTGKPPDSTDETIFIAVQGKLVTSPEIEPIVALQLVKVTFPKFVNCEITLSTVGLSIIHSAVNWLEL
jgi:hypothetical protein